MELPKVDTATGVRLTGVPDDIFVLADGRYFIIDYKTARYTGAQDALLPLYRVQLNGYAHIFQELGMGVGLCKYVAIPIHPREHPWALAGPVHMGPHYMRRT